MNNNSIRLQVDTQEEVTDIATAMVFGYRNKVGVFAFAKSEIDKSELVIPKYRPLEAEQKTPSQRLRSVLYRLWEQDGKKDLFGVGCDSDTHYKQMMDKLTNFYKEKLD